MRAALVASCLRGALPPVELRAVCFVRAIVFDLLFSIDITCVQVKLGMKYLHKSCVRLHAATDALIEYSCNDLMFLYIPSSLLKLLIPMYIL